MTPAVITIGLDPSIHLGPLTLSWHGVTIALGIVAGGYVAARWARRKELAVERLSSMAIVLTIAGIVGARVFYVAEHGGPLFGMYGFTFFGGVILAALALLAYVRRTGLSALYLDAVAVGLPLGVAVGRIGDVINGEHYGSPSTFFLAIRNSSPEAMTPDPTIAYQSGGLYEVLLGLAIFAIIWPLRHRLRRPGDLAWLVLALFAVGRFFELFIRTASPKLALGLNNAQWTSIAILVAVVVGRTYTVHGGRRRGADPPVRRTRATHA